VFVVGVVAFVGVVGVVVGVCVGKTTWFIYLGVNNM